MSDRGIWGIRILLTIVLAVVCIAAWSIGSLLYIDAGECYYINNPNKEVLRAIKSELNIEKMPEDLVISKCSSTLPFFDSDEVISIVFLPLYPYDRIMYFIKNLKYRRMDLN